MQITSESRLVIQTSRAPEKFRVMRITIYIERVPESFRERLTKTGGVFLLSLELSRLQSCMKEETLKRLDG